jgi:(p)ppGpp synthase/HD superfamily hydrolase
MDTDLLERAFALALEVHADGTLKGKDDVPYLAHLFGVATFVLERGGSDQQVAAALLHDAVEDGGGRRMLDRIRAEVGREVARLVEALSDSFVDTTAGEEKAPWLTRKARYLRRLVQEPREALLVSVADKLYNARAILADYRRHGDALFRRFSEQDPAAHLWYYRSLADVLNAQLREDGRAGPLAEELERTVDALAAEVRRAHPDIDERVRAFAVKAAAVPDA